MIGPIYEWIEHTGKMPSLWKDSRRTERFGIRAHPVAGASPLHLGEDRAGPMPENLTMPFDGILEWKRLSNEKPWGTILVLMPREVDLEVQIAHTVCELANEMFSGAFRKGDRLPIRPGEEGLSRGIHTHTEVVMPATPAIEKAAWMKGEFVWLYRGSRVNKIKIERHAKTKGLDATQIMKDAESQIESWGIEWMTLFAAKRKWLPEYRMPSWGAGPTIHADPGWLGI